MDRKKTLHQATLFTYSQLASSKGWFNFSWSSSKRRSPCPKQERSKLDRQLLSMMRNATLGFSFTPLNCHVTFS
ncbi:hypothetical protein OUZ56_003957 [Daphnia magna]|uniref:Uncharacterized protein n=1 Tax=Daphnia magna TaxID=35525 RepID=A0ABQ9YNB6_9CRUS|nr:hypothetical protein OUZ56_003957 [Daphnia magna]